MAKVHAYQHNGSVGLVTLSDDGKVRLYRCPKPVSVQDGPIVGEEIHDAVRNCRQLVRNVNDNLRIALEGAITALVMEVSHGRQA